MAGNRIHRQLQPNDFNDNELLNVVLQKLISPPIVIIEGKVYYDSVKKIPFYSDGVEWIPFFGKPVQYRYANESEMLSNQFRHNNGYIYYRSDQDIYYEYLGTTVGSVIADYKIIGGKGLRRNILDQNSSLLIDRDNLQFNRLILQDDVGNNKTIITRPPSITISSIPPSEQILEGDAWINNITWKYYAYYDEFWVETKRDVSSFIGSGVIEFDPVFQASASSNILQVDIDKLNTIDNLYNIVSDYRSIFETDGYLYSGYLLNSVITITRTQNSILEKATNLTDLNTDWANRLNLTYILA